MQFARFQLNLPVCSLVCTHPPAVSKEQVKSSQTYKETHGEQGGRAEECGLKFKGDVQVRLSPPPASGTQDGLPRWRAEMHFRKVILLRKLM